jgi:asparagine synthase (glutamine-hydrolysing)
LARDAIGERTLYYAPLSEGVLFASTIRSLLSTGLVPRTLRLASLGTYLAYAYLPGRETLVDGVLEVLPGEVIRFRPPWRTSERTRLWSLSPETSGAANPPAGESELKQLLRRTLERAVRRRLPWGRPAGAFLSGGLDSSLVVALACLLHDGPVHTYSVSFGDGFANELPFSSLVAAHCRTRHSIVEVTPADIARQFDASIAMLSDPIGDPLTVPNSLLFQRCTLDAGVVLNGEGGDPCFGGPKNLPMLLAELYGGNGNRYAREQSYLRAHLKCFDDLADMLSAEVCHELAAAPLEETLAQYFADPRWNAFVTKLQMLNITFKGGHHILPKVDSLSAPFGVVARSPLFDRTIVELSFAIPPQLKLRGSVEKYLLKEAVKDLLPPAIIQRPKSGMLVPVEAWFQGPLAAFARDRLLGGLAPLGLFKRAYLERLLNRELGGLRPRHGAKIWLLLTLESWLRQVLGRRV